MTTSQSNSAPYFLIWIKDKDNCGYHNFHFSGNAKKEKWDLGHYLNYKTSVVSSYQLVTNLSGIGILYILEHRYTRMDWHFLCRCYTWPHSGKELHRMDQQKLSNLEEHSNMEVNIIVTAVLACQNFCPWDTDLIVHRIR